MHTAGSLPAIGGPGPAPEGIDTVTRFLAELTRVGGMLFSDDGSVPCGVMFQATGGAILFSSASSKIRDLYAALNAFHALRQGPVPRALSSSGVHVAHDTGVPTRPPFFKVPAAHGFASILSVPMPLGEHGRAALAFYAHPAYFYFFSVDRRRIAAVFAEQSRRSIELALELTRARDLTGHLRAVMQSRSSIDQAIGIVMGQNRCSQDHAFEVLKRASSTRNIKLSDLAADIVERAGGTRDRLRFDP